MSLKTVTFRVPGEKVATLDEVAAIQQRDRSFVINEAVDQYLSLQEYHRGLIVEGLRQSEAGELIDHEDVVKMLEDLAKKRKKSRR